MKLPLQDERFLELLSWWGTPYSWGGGRPSDALSSWPPEKPPAGLHGARGLDCSGFAQVALVRLGILSPKAPDRNAAGLWDAGKDVKVGEERMGDLAFYGPPGRVSHVMVVVGPGVVMGARGGDATTNGNNPRAFVQIEPLWYWSQFLGVRRLKEGPGA